PSPQEAVSGFPLSIDDYNFDFAGGNINLDLTIGLHLSNSDNTDITGSATIALVSTLKTEGLQIKRFSLDSLRLECVTVGSEENPIDLDLFTLWGGVCFRDYNGGKGFEGELHFGVADAFSLDLYAGFGKYGTPDDGDFGTSDYYGWWYLDGTARINPGITLVPTPPVMLSGFGGGIYWNVDAPQLSLDIEQVMAMAEGEASMPEFDPSPEYGTRSLAFRTSLSIGDDNLFSIDPEIAVTWDVEDGIQAISFNGSFWLLYTDFFDRDGTARLYGNSMNSLTFEYGADGKKRVALVGANSIHANIIPGILHGAGPNNALVESAFAFGHESLFQGYDIDHSDADNQYWFFNAGNPYVGNMGGIVFNLPGFNLNEAEDGAGSNMGASVSAGAEFYLMMGQNIPSELPEPPGRVSELFGRFEGGDDSDGSSGELSGNEADGERDAQAATTGSGLVMGAHVFASAEINAVVYARLAILTGMDLMLFNFGQNAQCITTGGELIEDVGINGWYGTGRAYAGLEGTIGAKGKILGKEIDVKIMELLAAVMLDAGGPDLMWLDGRANISYSILNGFIEGSASMQIAVGDRCQPSGSPFGFPVIVESDPSESTNEDVDPFIHPALTFSIPVAENPNNPAYDRIMRVRDIEGNLKERVAYIEEFTIEQMGSAPALDYTRDYSESMLTEDGRAAQYHPNTTISGPYGAIYGRNWRMTVVIRAKEKLANGSWTDIISPTDGLWEERLVVDFNTAPLPEQLPDSQVGKTKPFRYQRFYLQQEPLNNISTVWTRNDYSDSYFEPIDRNDNPVTYEAMLVNMDTGDESDRFPLTYYANPEESRFFLPTLQNSTNYKVKIIRKIAAAPNTGLTLSTLTIAGEDVMAAYNDDGISSEYQVNALVFDIDQLGNLNPGETLIYEYEFRTSAYNTLGDKLSDLELAAYLENGYQRIEFEGGFEGFDEYDILGRPDPIAKFSAHPLVYVDDPFNSNFHNQYSEPILGGFVGNYLDNYYEENTGIYAMFDMSGVGIPDLDFNLQVQGLGLNGNNNSGFGNGSNNNSNNNADPVRDDLSWPYPGQGYPINFDWTDNIRVPLNDRIETDQLYNNDPGVDYLTINLFSALSLRYYVTEQVLEDAENYVDFAVYWDDYVT
ncbi:MAG: hypothetical protein AAGA62_02410, partial [Bacteroidota bacterium]